MLVARDPRGVVGQAILLGLAALGEVHRAKEWIDRALLLDPENISMRYNLACALAVQLKEPEAAIDVLKVENSTVRRLQIDKLSR